MENSLVIKPKSKQKESAPTGLQPACVVEIINHGIQQTKFGEKSQLSLVFELQATDSNGEHFILRRKYNRSLHPKSNLRSDLERWRGAPFDEDKLRRGFDLTKVVGKPCMVFLEERENGFIAIESVLPPDGHAFKGSRQHTRINDR